MKLPKDLCEETKFSKLETAKSIKSSVKHLRVKGGHRKKKTDNSLTKNILLLDRGSFYAVRKCVLVILMC